MQLVDKRVFEFIEEAWGWRTLVGFLGLGRDQLGESNRTTSTIGKGRNSHRFVAQLFNRLFNSA